MTTFALAEVKAVDTKEPNGEFEAVLSAPTLDRDGEVIEKGAFNPLPDSIPIHAFHDFQDPIGRAQPFYDGDLLKVRGIFASTARAQEIRTLVTEGVISNMSVGFMSAERETVEKVPHIKRAEILEGSFVSIPSNREAAVLVAKRYAAKAGARNNGEDAGRLQQIHDLSVANGADCESKGSEKSFKAVAGSYEQRRDDIAQAARQQHPDADWVYVVATFDDTVIYEIYSEEGERTQVQAAYEIDEQGEVNLSAGDPVEVVEVVQPAKSTTPAETAAAPAAADLPADVALQDQVLAEIARTNAALLIT